MTGKDSHGRWGVAVGVLATVAVAVIGNWDAFRSGRVGNLRHDLTTPRSGERETHPASVQFVIDYCRDRHVKVIAVSPELGKNRFLAQPLTEGVYPAVVQSSAAVYVSYSSEAVLPGFATEHIVQGLRLVRRR